MFFSFERSTANFLRFFGGLSLAFTVVVFGAPEAQGQCTHIDNVITASDGQSSDYFGQSLARDGNRIVVGAYLEDQAATSGGAAYVFEKQSGVWVEIQKLMASDAETSDWFGWSVAIDGDVVLVGAPGEDEKGSNAGAAYVFRFNGSTWVEEQKLIGGDAMPNDQFGYAVTLEGDHAAVGSPFHDDPLGDDGAVYYYHFQGAIFGWLEDGKLIPIDADTTMDYFGAALSMDNDNLFVGAHGDGANSGSVFWFERSGNHWIETQKILTATNDNWTNFGQSLDAEGDVLIVGAPLDDEFGSDSGVAYVFRRNGSTYDFEVKLVPDLSQAFGWFGHAVAISGNSAVVGCPLNSEYLASCGLLYKFQYNGTVWAQEDRVVSATSASSDQVGTSVDMSGADFVVGAIFGDDGAAGAGAVYEGTVGKFVLDIEPNLVNVGELVTFRAFCGDPGDPLAFVLLDVSGQPFFVPLLYFFFDSNHEFGFDFTPGPNLSGLDFTFGVLKVNPFGKAIFSNLDTMTIN